MKKYIKQLTAVVISLAGLFFADPGFCGDKGGRRSQNDFPGVHPSQVQQ